MNIRHAAGRALLALIACALLAPAAAAQRNAPSRAKLRIFVNGLWNASKIEFDATRGYTEWGETSSVDSSYTLDPSFGFEAGARYDFTKHLGLAASFASGNRDGSATFSAGLPHPLFFDRKRNVSGEATDLPYTETAVHAGLVFGTSSGSWDLAAVAGVAFFQVEAEQIDLVQYRHEYPYDAATVTGTTRLKSKDTPLGISVAASVDYRLHKHVALGVLARYAGATAQLAQADDSTVDVTVGGLQVGAGIRLIF